MTGETEAALLQQAHAVRAQVLACLASVEALLVSFPGGAVKDESELDAPRRPRFLGDDDPPPAPEG